MPGLRRATARSRSTRLVLRRCELALLGAILLAIALVTPIGPLIDRIALRPLPMLRFCCCLLFPFRCIRSFGIGLIFFGPEGFRTTPLTSDVFSLVGVSSRHRRADDRDRGGFQPAVVLFFEFTLSGKALRATAITALARASSASGRQPRARLRSCWLAAWRDLRHPDRAGDDTVLRFRFHDRAEGICRRDFWRVGELSGHRRWRHLGR